MVFHGTKGHALGKWRGRVFRNVFASLYVRVWDGNYAVAAAVYVLVSYDWVISSVFCVLLWNAWIDKGSHRGQEVRNVTAV
jgi:hypothetical protein